ncbi:hypothetical protein HDE76_000853 [Rhodanobacter sp. ANJX3]|uniref:hypothetical protein n=1 Tax=Rhodanobacter sp. ANJX3 TaxID=2723083 RepID=UPI00161DE1FA|nr:hypothetical protein [Rhodanobacter sp. ANJX3]
MRTMAWLAAGMLSIGSFTGGGLVLAQSSPWRPASSDQLNKYAQTHGSLKQIAPIFSQLVLISPPSNFRPVFEHLDDGGQSYIHESVPGGESTAQWTQMITVTGAKGLASRLNITPQFLAADLAKRFHSACPTSFSDLNLGEVQLGGANGYAMVASCGSVTADGSMHSESTLILEIRGSNDDYSVQWAVRSPASAQPIALDEAAWRARLQHLQPIKLCPIVPGERMPYPSCAG